tara:strand:+ start:2702 stop:3490 length:789 start_codon:yes stop_codon:yes gene_type:complete
MKRLGDFYQIHKDETIYLIGNGAGLLDAPKSYKDKISRGISIGVNSSHLFLPTTYQACSTWSCYLLSCHYGEVSGCRFYQGQRMGNDSSWPFGGPTTLNSSFYSENNTIDIYSNMEPPSSTDVLFRKPEESSPFYGTYNIMFTATNLATMMGANKIVYLGFDQRNNGHYYDTPESMPKYKEQTNEIKKIYSSDTYIVKDIEDMEVININKEKTPDYLKGGWCQDKLSIIFDAMKKNDVTPIVHIKDSIVHEAGAIWKDYEYE